MDNGNYTNNMSNIPGELGRSSFSFIDWVRSITWPVWLLFFVVLAFLGFNILTFISTGAGDIGSWINIIVEKIKNSGKLVNTIKNTFFVSATGTEGIIDSTATVSNEILDKIQESTQVGEIPKVSPLDKANPVSNTTASSSVPSTSVSTTVQPDVAQANTLNKAINTATNQQSSIGNTNYQADDALSSIQSGGSKSGWCYIGEDRGFRSCAEVNSSEQCMSGDIFPSNEICVNPRLRA